MSEAVGLHQELSVLLTEVSSAAVITLEEMEALTAHLETLWAKSQGDPEAQSLIQQTWNHAQVLADQNAILSNQVVATSKIATAAIEEGRAARDQLSELEEALDEVEEQGYTMHPRVQGIVEIIDENLREEWEGDGLHLTCPGCAASENGWYDTLGHDAVNNLCYALFSPWAEEIPVELKERLAEAINGFHKDMEAHEAQLRDVARSVEEAEES